MKARSCANGSVQREHVAKEEAASPTVALESVFVTAAIDMKENTEVVTIDIPGTFLHATNDDYVVMRMNGTLAELMAKTDPTPSYTGNTSRMRKETKSYTYASKRPYTE